MSSSCALGTTVVAATSALLLAGCGGGTFATTPLGSANGGSLNAGATGASVVEVMTCLASTTVVVGDSVAVSRDGLHVQVTDRSGHSGTYLNYGYTTADGGTPAEGDPVPAGTSERVLALRPGPVDLNCSNAAGTVQTPKVRIRAVDPHGYYRTTSLADLGCIANGAASWAIGPEHGSSIDDAVAALVAAAHQPAKLSAVVAPIGYVGSSVVTYVIQQGGKPRATAVVTPDPSGYLAGFDLVC